MMEKKQRKGKGWVFIRTKGSWTNQREKRRLEEGI